MPDEDRGRTDGLQRWILLDESDCTPGREAEHHRWSESAQVPALLALPGVVRVRRYAIRSPRDGRGTFLTLCDIETDDIDATRSILAGRPADPVAAAGPPPEFPVWRDVLFRRFREVTAAANATGGAGRWLNMIEHHHDPARPDEYHAWYDTIHVPDVLQSPGFASAGRYRIRTPQYGRGEFLTVYEIATDDIDATLKARAARRDDEARRGRGAASRNHLVRPVWRDVLWRQLSDRAATSVAGAG